MLLGPEGTISALQERFRSLDAATGELRDTVTQYSADLPRVTLLETEYQLAIAEAERNWVENIVAELASGSLTWAYEDFAGAAASYVDDEA
jgi:hypothetical protein